MLKLFSVPHFSDPEKQRRANILVVSQFMVFFIVAAILVFTQNTTPEHTETLLQGGLGMLAMVVSYFFLRNRKIKISAWIIAITGWLIFTLDLAFIAGIRGISTYGQFLMVIFSGLVISGKSALLMTILTLTANFGILRMETLGYLEKPMPLPANGTRWFIQTAYSILAAIYIWTADRVIRQALSKSHQAADQYRALFDLTSDGVVMIGLDWKIISANAHALQMLGYVEDEFVGMEVNRWEDFEDPDLMEKRRFQVLAGDDLPTFEEVLIKKGGSRFDVEMSLSLVNDNDGQPHHVQCIIRDVTARKEYEQQLQHQALYDPLTNLPNRILFENRYQLAHSPDETNQSLVAVLFVDLDNFKMVNDDFGHAVGDQVLMKLGDRMQFSIRESDIVARLGGDEFVIILEDIHNKEDVRKIVRKIQQNISQPMMFDGQQIHVTASIGINISEKSKLAETDLVKTSDSAMYQVKEDGKNDFRFYDTAPRTKDLPSTKN
jgi:diguanylate cyclase (GGDEF)-like protein/PAS domain S-box-containing protein